MESLQTDLPFKLFNQETAEEMLSILQETLTKIAPFCQSTHFRLLKDKLTLIQSVGAVKKAVVLLQHALRDLNRVEALSEARHDFPESHPDRTVLFRALERAKEQLDQAKEAAIQSQARLAATADKIKVFEVVLDLFVELGGNKSLNRTPAPYYNVKPVGQKEVTMIIDSLQLPIHLATSLSELFQKTIGTPEGSITKEEALRYFKMITAESS
jgi:hypothetical protein